MTCVVCTHPQRHLIEQALHLEVKSPGRVAADFGLAVGEVQTHLQTHVLWLPRLHEVCLPGLCQPYGYTPPGHQPLCRHCGATLPQEDNDHA